MTQQSVILCFSKPSRTAFSSSILLNPVKFSLKISAKVSMRVCQSEAMLILGSSPAMLILGSSPQIRTGKVEAILAVCTSGLTHCFGLVSRSCRSHIKLSSCKLCAAILSQRFCLLQLKFSNVFFRPEYFEIRTVCHPPTSNVLCCFDKYFKWFFQAFFF